MLLVPGDGVLLLAPAFAVADDVAENAMRFWEHVGMRPTLMPHALGRYNTYAGTDEERLADMLAALQDTEAKAIHCLRGGYGFTRILDALPLQNLLRLHPKYLLGFSDITAGLLAWQAVGFGHLAVHAPMASHLKDWNAPEALALAEYLTTGHLHTTWQDVSANREPHIDITAPITGGNLTLLAHTVGSQYPLKAAGHILFLEDVGEQLYQIDRMMVQLKRAGALEGVKGIVLGYFTDLKDTTPRFGTTVEEIVRAHAPIGVPIIAGYPAGHARPNLPIPFGVEARLQVKDSTCSLDAGLAVS